MLDELRISNFAIIDQLELAFAPGFNVITGETGAGKSIIIDAVELLLGGKADTASVRGGTEKAVVEGVFALNNQTKALLRPILDREDLTEQDPTDYFVTLSREIRSNGRSTARVNGVTVSQEILREIGELLVDIHGQSEHLSLLKPRHHIDLLDRYADLLEVRSALAKQVENLSIVRREMNHLLEDEAALKRRADQLRHEVDEIDAAQLRPGEEEELRAERNRLSNSEQLAKLTTEVVGLLNGEDTSGSGFQPAVDQLMQVASLLSKLVKIDPDLKDDFELTEGLSAQVQELAINMSRYADKVEFSPERLDELEERLELLGRLRRRYGATIEDVLTYAERAHKELTGIEHSDERLAELREKETELLRAVGELAERISEVRVKIGRKLGEKVVGELADLRMENAKFEVQITQREDPDGCFAGNRRLAFDYTGIDQIEFMMSANPGEPLRPLVKVASGGETARIMLALKRVLSQADQTPTLIFDEIDQGIGGRVGSVVGEKLWMLANGHQVMVVTHLPQLAGYADKHFHARKQAQAQRTITQVIPLDDDKLRVSELAAMLGATGESGQKSAQELLDEARQRKAVKPALAEKSDSPKLL
jgi:DNA repair protein RecN (Recombination protein N)